MTNVRMARAVATTLSVTLLVAGCSSGDDSGGPAVDLDAGATLSVIELGEPFGFNGLLSPDGSRIAYAGDGLCIASTAGGGGSCVDVESVDLDRARWSHDSAKLVFEDDFFRAFREPDVRVLDPTEMTLTNLTDDGVDELDEFSGGFDPAVDLDVAATFLPDGTVVFLRVDYDSDDTRLMQVTADGTVSEVASLAIDPQGIADPPVPVGDGSLLLATAPLDGDRGLYRIDLERGTARELTSFSRDAGFTQIMDVDAGSTRALVRFSSPIQRLRTDQPSHAIIDLETGERTDLFPSTGADDQVQPLSGVFTPDGEHVVFIAVGDGANLYAVDVANPDTLRRVARLDAADPEDGDEALWNPAGRLRWNAEGQLIGEVGSGQVATVTFGAGG